MNLLRNVPISKRLWLIPVVAVVMLFILGMLMIQQVRSDLYRGKQEATRNVVEAAAGVFEHYHKLETSGAMTTADAQQAAIEQIRLLRYDGQDYFWINDLGPKMIMHPMQPKLDGQDLSKIKDPEGKELFNEMVAIARRDGAGLVDYMWAKPGEENPVPKISYVQLFKPWGWIIGSGIYVDDVEQEFWNYLTRFSLIGLLISAIMAVLVAILIRSIVRPLRHTMAAMANIASGEADLTRTLDVSGNDELTTLGRDFNRFTQKLRTVVGQLFETSGALDQSSRALSELSSQAHEQSQQQMLQMEQVATAVNEVTYAVQEVAKNAEHASTEVGSAENQAGQGQRNIETSLQQIDALSATIGRFGARGDRLYRRADQPARTQRRDRGCPCRRTRPWLRRGGRRGPPAGTAHPAVDCRDSQHDRTPAEELRRRGERHHGKQSRLPAHRRAGQSGRRKSR